MSKVQDLADQIWKTLPADKIPLVQSATSSSNKGSLRVDVYPRNLAEQFCLGLQQACHREQSLQASETSPTDPFGGPVAMTMSASKCSHRLTIILSDSLQNAEENPNHKNQLTYKLYWGLMCRETDKSIMEMKLNHQASEEINVVAPDPETGGEVKPNIPTETPLSRAYYKLDQVWNDYLEPERKTLDAIRRLEEASAVDFGSAPGGWTQVIAHRVPGLKTVCSVDRGIVAERVTKLPNVKYIHGIIDDCQANIEPSGPFAIVTCDASKLWSDVMDWFTKIVVQKAVQSNNDEDAKAKFTLPCIFIITMKLPFKTLKSVQRHVELIHNKLQNYLSDMVAAMYPESLEPIQTRSVVAHLMANSDGERTIIVIFEQSKEEES
jgi:23S rRNA U2552 (ribose-2'-O)-methylase RlmE/FtsJ